jgi:hypothetical protein
VSGAGLDRDRLAKVLGLLSSDHDGEVTAAARQAERLRRQAGVSWPDVLAPDLGLTLELAIAKRVCEQILDENQRRADGR